MFLGSKENEYSPLELLTFLSILEAKIYVFIPWLFFLFDLLTNMCNIWQFLDEFYIL